MAAEGTRVVPGDNASDPERREWLAWAFTVADGWGVGEITRYGGSDHTPITIEIVPPGDGNPRVVRVAEERDAAKHGTLRLALTRDAGLKAAPITNAKIAGDAYYVLCKLAHVVGGSDPRDEAREWIDGYRQDAQLLHLSLAKGDLHATLDRLRRHPYSKRQINLWLAAVERDGIEQAGPAPRPPLIRDTRSGFFDADAGEWTSITHLATYVRWGREQSGAIRDDALSGRVVELGGDRWEAKAWDGTTRARGNRIITRLVRLPPEETPDV